jgi:GrpB-like predicted nucleotidyltransferase (UPF0157 family)
MTYRFSIVDVLDLVTANDGDYDDGLNAFVSAGYKLDGSEAEIELTTTEDDQSARVAEKFRVTVERIEAS